MTEKTASRPLSKPSSALWRYGVMALVAAGLLLVGFANLHLVWVAVTSQPTCVAHVKLAIPKEGQYSAAKSAC